MNRFTKLPAPQRPELDRMVSDAVARAKKRAGGEIQITVTGGNTTHRLEVIRRIALAFGHCAHTTDHEGNITIHTPSDLYSDMEPIR